MNTNPYRPTLARALILSPDPLVGALLGVLAELAGCEPVFPVSTETPRDALRATRPAHMLVDCDDPAASDESLFGNAMMIGARLFFFGTESRIATLGALSERYQINPIVIPRDIERLPAIISIGANESIPRPPQSTVQ